MKIKWGILADICNKNISLALWNIFHRIKEYKYKSFAYINFLFMKSYFKKRYFIDPSNDIGVSRHQTPTKQNNNKIHTLSNLKFYRGGGVLLL